MIYSGDTKLLSKLFEEEYFASSVFRDDPTHRTYKFALKKDLLFYRNKFSIKSQKYADVRGQEYLIDYVIVDDITIYPRRNRIKNISFDHKIVLDIDDYVHLQFLLEIR